MIKRLLGGYILKKVVIAVMLMLVMLTGCNKPSEESFKEDSSRLYTQIFKDGEQSESVKELHKEYMDKYESFSEEDLYIEVDNLYNSLDSKDGESSKYLVSVMNMLNK